MNPQTRLRGTLRSPFLTTINAGGGVATLIDHRFSAAISSAGS